jgi:hypothetical protein
VRVAVCSVAARAVSVMCAQCYYAVCIGDSGGEAVRCTSLFARTCYTSIVASNEQNSDVSNAL